MQSWLTAVRGLVWAVPTVVLSVTFPPEWNALVIIADKLKGQRRYLFTIFDLIMCYRQISTYSLKLAHLTCSAVGQAMFAIGCEVKVCGAGTLVATSRREQTKVAAASIVDLAWVVGHWRTRKCTQVEWGLADEDLNMVFTEWQVTWWYLQAGDTGGKCGCPWVCVRCWSAQSCWFPVFYELCWWTWSPSPSSRCTPQTESWQRCGGYPEPKLQGHKDNIVSNNN